MSIDVNFIIIVIVVALQLALSQSDEQFWLSLALVVVELALMSSQVLLRAHGVFIHILPFQSILLITIHMLFAMGKQSVMRLGVPVDVQVVGRTLKRRLFGYSFINAVDCELFWYFYL